MAAALSARHSGKIKEAFDNNPDLPNLLLDPYFREQVLSAQEAWRRVVGEAVRQGIPVPTMSSALSFFDGYRSVSYLPICYKHNGITSVRILTSVWINRVANTSTPTGQGMVEI